MSDHFQMRLNPEREKLIERVQEAYPATNRAEAVEMALKAALDYRDLIESEREDIREQAREATGDNFRLNVRTEWGEEK